MVHPPRWGVDERTLIGTMARGGADADKRLRRMVEAMWPCEGERDLIRHWGLGDVPGGLNTDCSQIHLSLLCFGERWLTLALSAHCTPLRLNPLSCRSSSFLLLVQPST